jgi:hypothetical protein
MKNLKRRPPAQHDDPDPEFSDDVNSTDFSDPKMFEMYSGPIFEEADRALERIERKHNLELRQRIDLREALMFEAMRHVGLPELPKTAPERWSEREGRKENPVVFIRRVYDRWLGRNLRRSHLLELDPSLYQALAMWMRRHPEDTLPELSPGLINRVGSRRHSLPAKR